MATLQIRDVPEDVYETIRLRARAAGQSMQSYLLARLVDLGRRPTPDEVIADLRRDLASRPSLEIDTQVLLDARDQDRP